MRRGTDTPPVLIGTLQMTAALTTAILGVFSPDANGRQLLAGLGVLLITAVGLVGLFLARGRWARRFLWLAVAVESSMFVVFDTGWFALALTALAALGLGMPGLDGWVRQLKKADAPPNTAVLLPLALLSVPVILGLLRHPNAYDWGLSGAAVVAAWSYGRAHKVTLWSLRLVYPLVGFLVAFSQAGWPGIAVGVLVVSCTALAWSPGALRAIQPLVPRRVEARPVFAEMAPPGLMEEIGRDTRGRKQP